MSQVLLGVDIIEPGFTKIKILPILNIIKGAVPLPINLVDIRANLYDVGKISIDINAKKGEYDISMPKSMKIDLYLPLSVNIALNHAKDECIIKHIVYTDGNSEINSEICSFEVVEYYTNKYYAYIDGKSGTYEPGLHRFKIIFINIEAIADNEKIAETHMTVINNPFPPIYYPCELIGIDNTTQGNWIGKYGNDGYSLFGFYYAKNGTLLNLNKLPNYVISFTMATWAYGQYISNTTNINALQNPLANNNVSQRYLGYYNGYNSMNFDIKMNISLILNKNKLANISFYCSDFDNTGIGQWIRIMDLSTFNIIAPTIYIDDINKIGKWVVYQVDRSIRIRIDQMRGKTSTISAIMFDS